MSPEKQRIAIATACGWTADSWCLTPSGWVFADAVPDYLNDLNAMHEVEKVLNQMQSRANAYHLAESEQNETWASCHIWHQSAAQRAEAFLRTMGLWEEEANTTKSVSSTSPATEESSSTPTIGHEADFVTKSTQLKHND